MSTTWTPEVGEIIIPETVKEKRIKGVLNRPAGGSRIKATLGQTVIVGTVTKGETYEKSEHRVIYIDIAPLEGEYGGLLSAHTIWPEDGWSFEILDDAPSIEDLAEKDEKELVSA